MINSFTIKKTNVKFVSPRTGNKGKPEANNKRDKSVRSKRSNLSVKRQRFNDFYSEFNIPLTVRPKSQIRLVHQGGLKNNKV